MQIFAYSNQGKLVTAEEAKKGATYFCPTCRAPVALRRGLARTPHFYHHTETSCKSVAHLNTQHTLLALLPGAQMEVPLGDRIADIYWPQEKIVFEIQCSPIPTREIYSRNLDYKSLDIDVIWIFYRATFKKAPIAPAYFTDSRGSLTPAQTKTERRPFYKRLLSSLVEFSS